MPGIPELQAVALSRPVRRAALVDRILARTEPLILIEAPAGMGKSVLLAEIAERLSVPVEHLSPGGHGGIAIWDVSPNSAPAALPEIFVTGRSRLILAKRPDQAVPGLSRALAYVRTYRLPPEDLLITREELESALPAADAEALLAATGGWPIALGFAGDTQALGGFLREEMLAPISAEQLVDLALVIEGAPLRRRRDDRLVPLVQREVDGRPVFAVPALASHMAEGVAAEIAARIALPAGARAVAEAYATQDRIVDAIEVFQRAGFHDNALRLFGEAGGLFFIYYHGPEAYDRVLSGFPHHFSMQSETIVMSLALQSLKRGDISRARRLLADRFGDPANEAAAVFSPHSVFSREFRAFRLLMLIYEDFNFTEELLDAAYALNAEFPSDAHLHRGSFYNTVLEFYIRTRRFAEAEEVAQRALFHYEAARAPLLSFYICLHLAMMRLLAGDTISARRHAQAGARYLAAMSFRSLNDGRLQALLEACIEYEAGRAEPLARFLNTELDDFAHGEIWPSLMEFALLYGSQAMAEHFSTSAARAFLDRWHIYQVSNRQFQAMIVLREVAILQNANRWTEAAERLRAVAGTIGRDWVLTAHHAFALLRDRDDIALALGWLRQITYETPETPGLDELLAIAIGSLHITDRQRMSVSIWRAHILKQRRDLTSARAILAETFETAARLGAIAPLAEERLFLEPLIDNQRIGGFLSTSPSIRQVIRKLRDSGRLTNMSGARGNLSRRESKILIMLSEGAANKAIAARLGLKEATVKFHLGNVYRKLGCKGRQEAIGTARALGLVG